ncbi:hypothetical protein HK101_004885 [Irineochytrium annulatum]|nr:hypothetical protein HK101_004885 [Irineochytrium annulatum]
MSRKRSRTKLNSHPGSHCISLYKTCGFSQDDEALATLKRISSMVKPIMQKRSWTLPLLREFFPDNPNLLGLNVNRGQEIRVRLRPHYDQDKFMDFESVLGTMLHELSHNIRGPHDAQFYKILDELTKELENLMAKGWKGDGFDGPGMRVGQGYSHNVPEYEKRKAALSAAEKRAVTGKMMVPVGGRKLGGGTGGGGLGALERIMTPGQLAAMAAEKRLRDRIWCGSNENDNENAPGVVIEVDDDDDGLDFSSRRQPVALGAVSSSAPLGPARAGSSAGDDWTCGVCTLINDPGAAKCDACQTARPGPGSSSSNSVPGVATGSGQTGLQAGGGRSRMTSTGPPPAKISRTTMWACVTCTLENMVGTKSCDACGGPAPTKEETVVVGDDGALLFVEEGVWCCPKCGEKTESDFRMCRGCSFIRIM